MNTVSPSNRWKPGQKSPNPRGRPRSKQAGYPESALPTYNAVLRRLWAVTRKPTGQAMAAITGCRILLDELRPVKEAPVSYDAFFVVGSGEPAPQLSEAAPAAVQVGEPETTPSGAQGSRSTDSTSEPAEPLKEEDLP